MYVMAINHDGEDYRTWKNVFDTFPPAKGGARFHRLNRNIENDNNITVVADFDSVEQPGASSCDDASWSSRRGRVLARPGGTTSTLSQAEVALQAGVQQAL